jgi:hypothetical protein
MRRERSTRGRGRKSTRCRVKSRSQGGRGEKRIDIEMVAALRQSLIEDAAVPVLCQILIKSKRGFYIEDGEY